MYYILFYMCIIYYTVLWFLRRFYIIQTNDFIKSTWLLEIDNNGKLDLCVFGYSKRTRSTRILTLSKLYVQVSKSISSRKPVAYRPSSQRWWRCDRASEASHLSIPSIESVDQQASLPARNNAYIYIYAKEVGIPELTTLTAASSFDKLIPGVRVSPSLSRMREGFQPE